MHACSCSWIDLINSCIVFCVVDIVVMEIGAWKFVEVWWLKGLFVNFFLGGESCTLCSYRIILIVLYRSGNVFVVSLSTVSRLR